MNKLCRTRWMVLVPIVALTALAVQAQNLSEEPQLDRPGGDYTHFHTTELRDCKRACATDRRCAAYSFNSVESTCYLKDQVTKTSRDSRTVSGVKEGWSGPGSGPGDGDRSLSEERGSDYRGGDYTNFRSRGLGDCQDACQRDRRCQAYTFNGRTGVCYLKDRVGERERNGETVTGRKGRGDDDHDRPHGGGGDLSREPGFDYYGNDYTSFRVPGDEGCREECRRDRRCAAYSFNTRSGMCYLKEEAGPLRRNPDTVTGVKRRR